jgi:hypothetical protein
VYVATGYVFLFVGIGLWGQDIILCYCIMCSRVLFNDFFMIFNLLLVLIWLCFIRL